MEHSPTTLAFDCAVVGASVALLHEGRIYGAHDPVANQQASRLVPMIEQVLAEAGIGYAHLARLITIVGPGSFTGLRIGLATAQGICAALPQIQISTLTTLEALAWQQALAGECGEVWAALNAGKGELYAQKFGIAGRAPSPLTAPAVMTPDFFAAQAGESARVVGNALVPPPACGGMLGGGPACKNGVCEAPLPSSPRKQGEGRYLPDARLFIAAPIPLASPDALRPLYIRAPDAKLPA